FDAARARAAAAAAARRARELGTKALCWEVPHHVDDDVVAGLVEGTLLREYRFERYKFPREGDSPAIERLIVSAHHDVSAPVGTGAVIARAQNRARDLGNTAANDMTPEALAAYATAAADRLEGLTVTVLDETAIREAGMGMFAAVAQGSAQGARLIRLQYDGAGGEPPRLAFVGKAVTFDTGGLSIKPAAKMHEMKFDMAGGAAVIEAIIALAELRAPVSVLGVVGATENMPGGHAVKPGDIVTALDGTTSELNNTDAEGRLVLGDCITYAIREGAEQLVDLATLTGGVVVALGSVFAGLMSNDDEWAASVTEAGTAAGEPIWRLPLHEDYAELVKGQYGQITNLPERREASTIVAAEFLHHFAGDVSWAHLDIAGTGFGVKRPFLADKGASGFGVRLLVELAQQSVRAPRSE
ncbi:MAG: leucyl aminopeptidase family protein, partial [Actinomycetota bacterium]|nr:leucyl aminopeptidase family protein [Actinomycetota bacterium]